MRTKKKIATGATDSHLLPERMSKTK